MPDIDAHRRGAHWFAQPADFRAAVGRAFEDPERRAIPEWEPLASLGERMLPVVRRILAAHPADDVVLAGHGTAWTLCSSPSSQASLRT